MGYPQSVANTKERDLVEDSDTSPTEITSSVSENTESEVGEDSSIGSVGQRDVVEDSHIFPTENTSSVSENRESEVGEDSSIGSAGHPSSCAAACKYVWKKRGCLRGLDCERCHLCQFRRPKKNSHGQ